MGKIRKLYNLSKEDDVRQYIIRRPLPQKEGKKQQYKARQMQPYTIASHEICFHFSNIASSGAQDPAPHNPSEATAQETSCRPATKVGREEQEGGGGLQETPGTAGEGGQREAHNS